MVSRVIEVTFVLIILYLVLTNSFGFTRVVGAIGQAYGDVVKVLQGR